MSILSIFYMNMKRYNLGIIYWEPYGNIRAKKKKKNRGDGRILVSSELAEGKVITN
jgi:hypothetical protein